MLPFLAVVTKTLKFMKKHFHKIIYVGLNPLDAEYDQVICDGNAVASDAVSHLIAYRGTRRSDISERLKNEIRYEAYCNTLKKNHINFNKNIVTNVSGSSEAGYQGAKRILERSSDVTAFFCMNDITAIGAIRAIHECGYRILTISLSSAWTILKLHNMYRQCSQLCIFRSKKWER